MFTKVVQDFQCTLRTMRRSPGLVIVAVLTLAIGIGGNTTIFSIVDAVLLRSLPFPEPQRLVHLSGDMPGTSMPDVGLSVPELDDFRDRSGVFEQISAVWPMDGNLTGVDKPSHIEAMAVSKDYFKMLGADPFKGHLFTSEDGIPWMSQNTVISYGAWKRLFGSDPNVLGRKIFLDYDRYVIVGVLPPGFHHPVLTLHGEPEFYLTGSFRGGPFPLNPPRTTRWIRGAVGRLKPGLTVEQAQVKLEIFARQIRLQYPNDYPAVANWTPNITPLQMRLAGGSRNVLLIMLGAVLLVLLICCATIANLLLARASTRRREFAIRSAIGARRGDLIRQLAVESFTLSFLGAAAGILFAAWAIPLLVEAAPFPIPHVNGFGLNATVLGFTLLACITTAVLCSLIPAFHVSRLSLVENLKDSTRGSGFGLMGHRSRSALVVCQISLSLMLMTGAGLMFRSLWNVLQIDPGFNPRHVLVSSVWLPPPGDPKARKYNSREARTLFAERLLERMKQMPGVESAAIGTGDAIPLVGWNSNPFAIEDKTPQQNESFSAQITGISPDYLNVVGGHLLAGRNFTAADNGDYRVALINQAMQRRFWPKESPLGKRIRTGKAESPLCWVIVGVVNDIKTEGLEKPTLPHIYFPIYQQSGYAMSLLLRTASRPEAQLPDLERAVQSVDPDLSIFAARSMDQVVAQAMGTRRFTLVIIGGFAAVAMGLALMGVYAVTVFAVSQRTQEIGVRIALGASRFHVLSVVIKQGMLLTLWGISGGVIGAALLTRFLQSFLFDATATDPVTYCCVAGLLAFASLVACYLPARRAANMDPTAALRSE